MTDVLRCECDLGEGCTCGAHPPVWDSHYQRSWRVSPSKKPERQGFFFSQERYDYTQVSNRKGYYDPLAREWILGTDATRRWKQYAADREPRIKALNALYQGPRAEDGCCCGGGSADAATPFACQVCPPQQWCTHIEAAARASSRARPSRMVWVWHGREVERAVESRNKGFYYDVATPSRPWLDHWTGEWLDTAELYERVREYKNNPEKYQPKENCMSCSNCSHVCGCGGGTTDPFAVTRMKLENEIASATKSLELLEHYQSLADAGDSVRWTRGERTFRAERHGDKWDLYEGRTYSAQVTWAELVTKHLICSNDVEFANFKAAAPAKEES